MDNELIDELISESKPIFKKIESNLEKLSSDKNEQTIEVIGRDLRSVSGAAEMFGFDPLSEYLTNISKEIEKYKTQKAQAQEILNLIDKVNNCFDILKETKEQETLYNLAENEDTTKTNPKNLDVFPVKLYVFENDRFWEYKNVMLAFEDLDIKMIDHTHDLEAGILITSSEALKANDSITNENLNILIIGDMTKEEKNQFTLPRSSDPAVIMAVCEIINRLK